MHNKWLYNVIMLFHYIDMLCNLHDKLSWRLFSSHNLQKSSPYSMHLFFVAQFTRHMDRTNTYISIFKQNLPFVFWSWNLCTRDMVPWCLLISDVQQIDCYKMFVSYWDQLKQAEEMFSSWNLIYMDSMLYIHFSHSAVYESHASCKHLYV